MDYEVEVHPVGEASKAGDAISIRYWNGSRFVVIVVDGGTDDAGLALVEHIERFYGRGAFIDHVVSTHPDTDHACGLREVLRTCPVGTLWIHRMWDHAPAMLPYFADKRWTAQGLANELRRQYSVVDELITLATERHTLIMEPFEGMQIGPFTVMSPQRQVYQRLVPQFRKTPEPDLEALEAARMLIGTSTTNFFQRLVQAATQWVWEEWGIEALREGPVTAAENESSTVLFGVFGEHRLLLTGDAGIQALSWACQYADEVGYNITSPTLVQVPHHGSRSNVSPSILNRILGEPLIQGSSPRGTAFVSVPKGDEKHPRKMVMNAFHRRGYPVHKTQGIYFRNFTAGMPVRTNEGPALPFGWFDAVEAYD